MNRIYFVARSWAEAGIPAPIAEAIERQGLQVFNAPRPLPGPYRWEGDFRHGVHYVAVDPGAETEQQLLYGGSVTSLDGWPVELLSPEEAYRRIRHHITEVVALAGELLSPEEKAAAYVDYFDYYREQLGIPPIPEKEADRRSIS